MDFLAELWLPIVVAAVLVFVVSSVLHMALPIHKSDYDKLPDEGRALDALRGIGLRPGTYVFPRAECMKDMGSPEMLEKFRRGPVGILHLAPTGPPAIGKSLVQWFLFSLLVGFFVAYIAWHSIARGVEYLAVFRLTGSIAFLGYGLSSLVDSIWKGQRWGVSLKYVFDGLLYALVTAGSFAWLWPDAVG